MPSYIDTAIRRYAGKIREWDVVNEAIEPNDGRADGMRAKSMWMDALGEDYVDIAFHRAREVDPSPMRFLTDFGIRSEEHTSELQSLMRISYAVFCLKQKKIQVYENIS